MKKIVSSIFYFITLFVYSQSNELKSLDVDDNGNIIIYCNNTKNTNLFFSYPIDNGTLGSDNFQFGFDKENNGKIAIVKGISGPDSNLLVTTLNGDIYSFIVKYKTEINKFNYFIKSENRIGNINEDDANYNVAVNNENKTEKIKEVYTVTVNDYKEESKTNIKESKNIISNNENDYVFNSKQIISKGQFFKRFYDEASGVKLHLSNIVYINEDLYFYLSIDNQSSVDYDINFLHFYISASNNNKRTSTQKILNEPVHIFGNTERVGQGEKANFVYVFKKFTINKEKKIEIVLTEITGERDLSVEVSNQFINNPNLNK